MSSNNEYKQKRTFEDNKLIKKTKKIDFFTQSEIPSGRTRKPNDNKKPRQSHC